VCGTVQQCELADSGYQVGWLWLWPTCLNSIGIYAYRRMHGYRLSMDVVDVICTECRARLQTQDSLVCGG
jgi:hypothetical protein